MNRKALLVGFCLFVAAGYGVQAADNANALMHPDRLKALAEITGKIESVNELTHQIALVDSANQNVTILATPDTVVKDSANHAFNWRLLRPGDPVLVYYEPKDHVALQIDRRSTTAESILGSNYSEKR